jgi:hypothetical protein
MFTLLRMNIYACVLSTCSLGHCFAADPSENLRKEIDAAIAKFEEANTSASEKLLEAFDKQAGLVAKSTKLKSDERDSVIAAIEAEKADFQRQATLPFSPAMRSSAVLYLNSLADAKKKAEKPFDKAIAYYRTKAKDSATATEITDEKQKLLGRRLLATWTFTHNQSGTYTVPLYSDGTAGPNRSWTLDDIGMVIRHRTQAAPQGCWVDNGVIDLSGKTCEIKNQLGHVKKGVLSNPEK